MDLAFTNRSEDTYLCPFVKAVGLPALPQVVLDRLALPEPKNYGFNAVVLTDRAAQDAIRTRIDFFGADEDGG